MTVQPTVTKMREATPGDAELLAALIRDAFRTTANELAVTPESFPRHPSNCSPDDIREQLDRGVVFYILEHDGAPCGCVGLEELAPQVYKFRRLAVPPAYRTRGVATVLVRHVETEARARGGRRLELGIFDGQPHLRAWYERLGFQHYETKSFPHLPCTVSFMYKELL